MILRRLIIATVTAIATLVPAVAAEPVLQPGTYRQIDPATKRFTNPSNQIVFVRGKNGRLSFSVNAIRGGDFNSGYVVGTLPASGASVTWTQRSESANCKLTFSVTPGNGLKVVQDYKFGDCGFGYGVLADGTYARTRSDGPLGKPADGS